MKQNTNKLELAKTKFYDSYHEKNDQYFAVIRENNFTYYYIQKAIHQIYEEAAPKSVLDVGCGVGTLAFYLAAKGSKVDGYDVSPRAIGIAEKYKKISGEKRINFYNKDVQKENFTNKYDLVICTEVIEHLENDEKMLKTLYGLLREGGNLLLSTPSDNAPLFKLGFLRKFDLEVGHLRRYSLESLIVKIESAGFEVKNASKVEGILRNSLFTLPYIGNFIRFIKGPLIPLFHTVDLISANIFGESDLIIIAEKN